MSKVLFSDTDRLEFLMDEGCIVNYKPYALPGGGYRLECPDNGWVQESWHPSHRAAIDAEIRSRKP